MSDPLVTVIIPAYKTHQSFFRESIESIFGQTYQNIELIVIDDGLSSENQGFLKSIEDERLIVLRNEVNLGQSRSVNRALSLASGEYIARMDADDIALPRRIEKQLDFLVSNPTLIACAARAEILFEGKRSGKIVPRRYPSPTALKCGLLFSCDMVHPTLFFRASAVRDYGIKYDENQLYAQDYMLWASLLKVGDVATMDDVVLFYRVHEGQVTARKAAEQEACAILAQEKHLTNLGFNLTEADVKLLFDLSRKGFCGCEKELSDLYRSMLDQASNLLEGETKKIFNAEFGYRIIRACLKGVAKRTPGALSAFWWPPFWRSLFAVKNWPYYAAAFPE